MYSNIVVPVTFEEGARHIESLKIARTLASEGARVTLLHVFESPPSYALQYIPDDLLTANRDGIRAELDAMSKDLPGGKGVLVNGHPGRSICDWVKDNGADLVVIASHRPGIGDVIWGSTAAHVVRHVACAVHVWR